MKARMIAPQDNQPMQDMNFSVTLPTAGAGSLGLIRARGADAGSFLQGQLTQDVLLMKQDELRLAAWCSAKGRMLASFWVWKNSDEEFDLLLSSDLLAPTLKRLKMFVLRAKCELSDITAQYQLTGLVGSAAQQAASTMNLIANYSIYTGARCQKGSENLLVLPTGHMQGQAVPCALRITPAQEPHALQASDTDNAPLNAWHALEISTGIARLSAPVSEAFVPQMLNYESAGGVNFKKGCYPGQEVVARSQFRGTLKRRGYIATSDAPLQAGQEVFDGTEAQSAQQPCGLVAQAAPHPAGGFIAIVSMQISAAGSQALHAGTADGAQLLLHALPYPLLEDI
jgi:tRNA-modifying protein YgfZ